MRTSVALTQASTRLGEPAPASRPPASTSNSTARRDYRALLGVPDVVLHLQSEPEARAVAERLAEALSHLYRHPRRSLTSSESATRLTPRCFARSLMVMCSAGRMSSLMKSPGCGGSSVFCSRSFAMVVLEIDSTWAGGRPACIPHKARLSWNIKRTKSPGRLRPAKAWTSNLEPARRAQPAANVATRFVCRRARQSERRPPWPVPSTR